jgi:hypothetical protein
MKDHLKEMLDSPSKIHKTSHTSEYSNYKVIKKSEAISSQSQKTSNDNV